jgi:hypothetical protein
MQVATKYILVTIFEVRFSEHTQDTTYNIDKSIFTNHALNIWFREIDENVEISEVIH